MPSIANLGVSLTARTGQFDRAMRKASRTIGNFRSTLTRFAGYASAISGGGIAALTARSMQLIDSQAKVADRLGAVQENLAGLDLAARRSGVSTQTLSMGMQRMTRRIAEAAQGAGEARGALKTLGLDANALVRLSADEQMRAIADELDKVGNASQRVALAMKLFDSEGVALVNTLRGGSKALDEAQRMAEQFGLAVLRVDAAKVEEANDAFAGVRDVFTGLFNQIGVALSPLITEAANAFIEWATEGDSAAIKVQNAINNYVLPVLAKVLDAWDWITGRIDQATAAIQRFAAASLEKSKIVGGGVVAGFFGVDIDQKIADLRAAAEANTKAADESLSRVGGGNLSRLRAAYSEIITAATERAAKKVENTVKPGAALLDTKKDAMKIGDFREVDLRRIALGGASGIGKKQEVHDPTNDRILEVLKRMAGQGMAGAVTT